MDDYNIYVAELAASDRGGAGHEALPADGLYSLSPVFPPVESPLAVLDNLIGRIESGQLPGRKVERDCWMAVMTPGEIMGYVDKVYDLTWYRGLGSCENINQQINFLLEALIRLDPGHRYILVAYKGQAKDGIDAN